MFGEVWAGWDRDQEAMSRLLGADIQLMPSGPDLPGMVIRVKHRHYIFVDDALPQSAPIMHRVVLAHEAAHVMRGVQRTTLCETSPLAAAADPDEWETWVQTGKMFIPRRYGRLRLSGMSTEEILTRHNDPHILDHMIEWRALMEIADGNWPGDRDEARAKADAIMRVCLRGMRLAGEEIHGCAVDLDPDDPAVRIARSYLGGHKIA